MGSCVDHSTPDEIEAHHVRHVLHSGTCLEVKGRHHRVSILFSKKAPFLSRIPELNDMPELSLAGTPDKRYFQDTLR